MFPPPYYSLLFRSLTALFQHKREEIVRASLLDVGGAVGLGPGRGTGFSHCWSPGHASQPCSLRLISQSLSIEVWEGSRDRIMDHGQNLQHLHLIGQRSSRAPQELVVWRIAIGHLSVLQLLLLHQIFGDEPSGLLKDPRPPPSIDPCR